MKEKKCRLIVTTALCVIMLIACTLLASCGVTKSSISLNKSEVTLCVGDDISLIATASNNATIKWSTSDKNVATVSKGTITAVGVGTAKITASLSDGKSAACTVKVSERVLSISQTTATIDLDESNMLTLTATSSDNGKITWKTGDPKIATVVGGVVRAYAPGNVTITAQCGSSVATCEITIIMSSLPEDEEPNPPAEEKEKFTVTFVDGDSTLATVEVEDGSKATAPIAPTKVGHSFGGWYLGEQLWNFDTAVTENITLVASWIPNVYNVLFDYENADDVTVSVEYGKTVTLPADPSKEHYIFLGWYLGDTLFDSNTAITTDMTLVPAWELEKHTVRFDTDGGDSVSDITVSYGNTAEEPAAPEKSGYIFMGWYLGEVKWSFATPITDDTTLTAKWQLEYLTVTFDSNGGSSVDAQNVRYDTYATSPASPTLQHHIFAGWYYGDKLWDFAEDKVTDHITLTARWTDKNFIVTIDPDNGEQKITLTVKSGNKIDAPETPTKAHHGFGGWYCNGNVWDFQTDTVSADITIKAKWIVDTHTVKLDAANGENISTLTYNYGELVSVPAVPTKAHHKFVGWYCGDKLWNFDTDTVSADTLLVAKWELDTHTVIFNANNGAPTSSVTVNYGDKLAVPAEPTKAHYGFGGWYCGDTLWNFDTDKVEGNITLVAKWVLDTHTVTFNALNGSAPVSITVNYGDKLTAPTSPIKAHYGFGGWYYGDKLWSFDGNVVESDITLTAKWIIDTHTVTFNADNGTNNTTFTVDYGSNVAEPNAPTKMHYTFLGWYVGNVKWSFSTPVTEDMTLTAKWEINTYTVTIDNANGDAITRYDVPYGTSIDTPADPVKAHSVFAGWYVGNVKYNFDSIIETNVTLTAKWTPDSHKVTFYTDTDSSVASITLTCGAVVTRPADPTKTGYTFLGWYNGDTAWSFSTPVTEDMTLTAKWKINTYTVTFTSNGAVLSRQTVDYGKSVAKPNDPVRNYYAFQGWYTASNSSQFDFSTPITKDITIEARWQRIYVTVYINNNNGDNVRSLSVAMGSTISEPTASKASTDYDSYVLDGWYVDGVCFDFSSPILKSITIKAEWITQDEANLRGVYDKLKATMGDESKAAEVYKAIKELYGFFDGDAILDWLAGLYDPNEGGFYYSNSARDFYPYRPDIESTSQALGWAISNGAFLGLSTNLAERFDNTIPDVALKIVNFSRSRQSSADGYFYHPQWPQGKENLQTDRYGRDLDNGNSIITTFDYDKNGDGKKDVIYRPYYCAPNGRQCEYCYSIGNTGKCKKYVAAVANVSYSIRSNATSALGSSVGFAVSKARSSTVSAVADTVSNQPNFSSLAAFKSWLEAYNSTVKDDSGKAHNLSALKSTIKSETKTKGINFYGALLDHLDRIQREVYNEQVSQGKTPSGMWQREVNFKAVWGLLKYASLYNDSEYGRPMLYPEYKVASAIEVIESDFVLKNGRPVHYEGSSSTVNLNDMMNQWTCINSLISNINNARKYWNTTLKTADGETYTVEDVNEQFRASATSLINATIKKLEYYKVSDNVFSYTPGTLLSDGTISHMGTSLAIIYGVPISMGLSESDVNGVSLISTMYRFIIKVMTGGENDAAVALPLCTSVDGDRFMRMLSEAEAPLKQHFTNDFENGKGNIEYTPTTDPDNEKRLEVVTDPCENDNALYFESHEVEKDKGYVNDSVKFMAVDLPGNCYVFEADIFVSSASSDGYILQNKLNGKLYMFEIRHNKTRGTVDIIESYTTQSRSKITTLYSGLPADRWFNLRIEYYTPDADTDNKPAIKVFVNGVHMATTNGYYGSVPGYTDSLAEGTYPKNNFTDTTFMALRAAEVYVYFDNVYCSAIYKAFDPYSNDTSNGTY